MEDREDIADFIISVEEADVNNADLIVSAVWRSKKNNNIGTCAWVYCTLYDIFGPFATKIK